VLQYAAQALNVVGILLINMVGEGVAGRSRGRAGSGASAGLANLAIRPAPQQRCPSPWACQFSCDPLTPPPMTPLLPPPGRLPPAAGAGVVQPLADAV
jgi:hypothetical protein